MRGQFVGMFVTLLMSFGTCLAQGILPQTQQGPLQSGASSNAAPTTSQNLQYKTEGDAKAHCGPDQVVWGNTSSHVLHASGSRYYGKTKHGAYMCKTLAVNAGYHESKQ